MSLLLSPMAKSGTIPFYNEAISQSCRFGANNVLTNEQDAPSDRKNFTLSMWFKRCRTGTEEGLAAGTTDNGNYVRLEASGAIRVRQYNTTVQLITNAVFRDTSAWYHLVVAWDLDNGTQADRVIIYVNGTRQTLATNTLPANTSTDSNFNQDGQTLHIGSSYSGGATAFFDGYIADVNFVDGTALAPTSFGETKNGVWIPITPTGLTYGNNGFRLQFAQVGVGTASTSTIGADTSGEDRHFTSAGILASDCAIPDSPENNFCIMGSSNMRRYGHSNVATMAEGGLLATSTGNATHAFGTMSIKQILANGLGVYFEMRCVTDGTPRCYFGIVAGQENNAATAADTALYQYPLKFVIDVRGYILGGTQTNGTAETNIGAGALAGDYRSIFTVAAGDVMGIAIKSDGKVFISKNGTFVNSLAGTSNPATGANPIHVIDTTLDWFPINGYSASAWHSNFGQDGSFSGTETSGGETDSNGIGDFFGAVPSGFVCLSTLNMAEPTIGPNSTSQATDYFNTLIYTGNGTDDRAITGLGFKPDWCWFKKRSGNMSHYLVDSARGTSNDNGTGTVGGLNSNATETEVRTSDGGFASFDDDGFTLGQAPPQGGYPQAGYERNNADGSTYVVWNWKANGGTATATISESGDNPAAVVQANPTAGFSLITYTGTGDAGTIAHGLGAVPTMMIIKNRDVADAWAVYHGANTAAPATDYLVLNTTAATADAATYWADTAPTSSVFTVHDAHTVNADGEKYIAYVFADVEGFSKMGAYIAISGSGSTPNHDGVFIYTGFRPAWIMIKYTGSGAWNIHDNTRSLINPMQNFLMPASSEAEATSEALEFLSNGVKMRSASGFFDHPAGGDFIYMAFAEQPFKYANAR